HLVSIGGAAGAKAPRNLVTDVFVPHLVHTGRGATAHGAPIGPPGTGKAKAGERRSADGDRDGGDPAIRREYAKQFGHAAKAPMGIWRQSTLDSPRDTS